MKILKSFRFYKKHSNLYEKMNFKHEKERKNAWKRIKKFKIKKKHSKNFRKSEKKKCIKDDEKVFIRHLFDAKWQ